MKVALCHLELSNGPEQKNIELLEKAVRIAAEKGANWVITPETAVQGYYFYKLEPETKVDKQPSSKLSFLLSLVKDYGLFLFLGCGEYDSELNCNFNSCIVFEPSGEICGRHRKIISHSIGAEAWARTADVLKPIDCLNIKVGVLVCADAWYSEHAKKMQKKGAQIIIDIAAWPPTEVCGNPLGAWEKCSSVTGLPVLVCNQTGKT